LVLQSLSGPNSMVVVFILYYLEIPHLYFTYNKLCQFRNIDYWVGDTLEEY